MKKLLISVITFIVLVATMLLSVFSVVSFADSENEIEPNKHTKCISGGIDLLVNLPDYYYNPEELISFYCVTNDESVTIVSYTLNQNGFSIINHSKDGNRLNLTLAFLHGCEMYSLNIRVILSDGSEKEVNVYGITTEYGSFLTEISEEYTYMMYYDYMLENGFINSIEYSILLADLNGSDNVTVSQNLSACVNSVQNEINNSTRAADTYAKITCNWRDTNNVSHPLKGLKVELYDYDSASNIKLLGTGYTSTSGMVTISFENADRVIDLENGGYDLFFKVYSTNSANNFQIVNANGSLYEYSNINSYVSNVSTGSTTNFTYTAYNSTVVDKAMQITQPIYHSLNFSKSMLGSSPSFVKVYYPLASSENGCAYYPSSQSIRIAENYYNSWDVIMHEYGHHVHNELNLDLSPGNTHYFEMNLINRYGSKFDGITTAWEESWSTVFGLIAQNYYNSQLTNIPGVNNSSYENISTNQNLETINRMYAYGEGAELSVAPLLWDLYDSSNSDLDEYNNYMDSFSYSAKTWFDLTTASGIYTLSDFVNYYRSYFNASMSSLTSLGKLLSYYKVAPNPIPVSYIPYSVSSTGSITYPRIGWEPGNSVTYTYNGVSYNAENDVFTVAVWTESGELLFRTETTNTYFRFTASQWSTVVNSGASKVIVSIAGEDDDTEYWTGYYFSEGVTVDVP